MVDILDDAGWLARAKQGDEDAFRELRDRNVIAVRGYCLLLLRNREDADDACQEAFFRVWKGLPRVRDFRTFLFKTAKNVCLTMLTGPERRNRSWNEDESFVEDLMAPYPDPEREVAAREEVVRTFSKIDLIAPRKREALLLRIIGLSYAEIGKVMGISELKARIYVAEARRELGRLLRRHGVDHAMQTS